jgi:hypothetical protein
MANKRVSAHRCDDKISPLQRNKRIRGPARKIFIKRGGIQQIQTKEKKLCEKHFEKNPQPGSYEVWKGQKPPNYESYLMVWQNLQTVYR